MLQHGILSLAGKIQCRKTGKPDKAESLKHFFASIHSIRNAGVPAFLQFRELFRHVASILGAGRVRVVFPIENASPFVLDRLAGS